MSVWIRTYLFMGTSSYFLKQFFHLGPGALSMNKGSIHSGAEIKPEDITGESMEFASEGGRTSLEGDEVISNLGSPAVSAANDIFWEQFLSETPSGVDHELDGDLDLGPHDKEADGDEIVGDSVEILAGDEHGGEVKNWWSKKPSVEQLSVQMGQLAPG